MKSLLFATLTLFAGHALADYVTGAYVDTDLEVDQPFNQLMDDDANGFLIGYGWTVKPWLAVEVTYTDFGDSSKTQAESYNVYKYTVTESLTGTYEGKALDLWLVGRFSPVSITKDRPLNIVPRLGLTAASSQGTLTYLQTVTLGGNVVYQDGLSVSESDSGVGYAYGIGLEVANVITNMDVYVDWRKHEVEMVFAGQRVDFDPSSIQAGINWHF